MMIKVSEASPRQLDWLVAKCVGGYELASGPRMLAIYSRFDGSGCPAGYFAPSTDWSQGGPILTEAKISRTIDHSGLWLAYDGFNYADAKEHMQCDRSELIAGLRCFVASKLGEEVEAPAELV